MGSVGTLGIGGANSVCGGGTGGALGDGGRGTGIEEGSENWGGL